MLKNGLWILALVVVALSFTACGKEDADSGKNDGGSAAGAPEKPKTPLITKNAALDWCKEHGVPESICTRCNASLVEGFKEKGDWCANHDVPESQCFVCHPELEAKFKAAAPAGALGK